MQRTHFNSYLSSQLRGCVSTSHPAVMGSNPGDNFSVNGLSQVLNVYKHIETESHLVLSKAFNPCTSIPVGVIRPKLAKTVNKQSFSD